MTNNDLQNTTEKTKDRATRTPLKITGASEELPVPAPHVTPVVLRWKDVIIIYYGNHAGQRYVNKYKQH
jgi:hypothetical protein